MRQCQTHPRHVPYRFALREFRLRAREGFRRSTEHADVHYGTHRQLPFGQPVGHIEPDDQFSNRTRAHRHRERRILRLGIRKVRPEIRISSGGPGGLHLLRDYRRARFRRSHTARRLLLLHRLPVIPHRPQGGRPFRQIRRRRHRFLDTCPGVRQYRRKPQRRSSYGRHVAVRQLRGFLAHIPDDRDRHTAQRIAAFPVRIPVRQPEREIVRKFPHRMVSGRFSERPRHYVKALPERSAFIFAFSLRDVLVFGYAVQVCALLIGLLPADRGDGTCRNGVVDVGFRIARQGVDAREAGIVEFEYVSGNGGTSAASDAGGIYVRFFQGVFQFFKTFVHTVSFRTCSNKKSRFPNESNRLESRCGF
ncbi:MAG: hypothetical protein QG650_8 [Patescibacteria group bacterium]|nr:hypothetical protein [Patescibacteria group bacterium]